MNLTIEKLVYGGDGLARLPADELGPGKGVFVPFVLPGEQIEAALVEQKPGFVRAHLDKIVQASAHRIPPFCPYFQRCGGCHYQHTSYEYQLEMKVSILKENLRRIAKLELESGARHSSLSALELSQPQPLENSDGAGICARLLQAQLSRIAAG